MDEIKAYPLCWPPSWKRSTSRKQARFANISIRSPNTGRWRNKLTVAAGIQRVLAELKTMGVHDWEVIISTNIPVKNNGLPYSVHAEPKDPGVAVYWKRKDKPQVMAIDLYDRAADNLGAIAASLSALRALERHGSAEILERAYTGFTALPPPMTAGRPWQEVLELDVLKQPTLKDAEIRYRHLVKRRHPDKGGSLEAIQELNQAITIARKELSL